MLSLRNFKFELMKAKRELRFLKYRDKFGTQAPTYLIIFDRRPETKEKPWDERISWEQDGEVTVLGC